MVKIICETIEKWRLCWNEMFCFCYTKPNECDKYNLLRLDIDMFYCFSLRERCLVMSSLNLCECIQKKLKKIVWWCMWEIKDNPVVGERDSWCAVSIPFPTVYRITLICNGTKPGTSYRFLGAQPGLPPPSGLELIHPDDIWDRLRGWCVRPLTWSRNWAIA